MSIAQFSLVRKTPVTLLRHAAGSYVDGEWIEGAETSVVIQANVHPFSDYQVMMLPESDRSRSWLWMFTSSEVRIKKEGISDPHGADRFYWDGDLYEAIKSQKYSMSISDHFEIKAARVELSPNQGRSYSMKNWIGSKFNMLTIIELDHIKDHTYPNGQQSNIHYFKCLCDCGNYTIVRKGELRENGTKSCGCLSLIKPVEDISGKKYNKLTTISKVEGKGNLWNCICECGNDAIVSAKNLKSGGTKTCGCSRVAWSESQTCDLTGMEFGRLTVIQKSNRGGRWWDCMCSCGNTKTVRNYSLTTGATASCGCLRKETAGSNVKTFYRNLREDQGLDPDQNISSNDKIARARFIPLAREIYARDGFCCVWCSASGAKLNAHHLQTWSTCPEKRFDKTNLVTLCEECHFKVHNNSWYAVPNPYMTILLQGYSNVMEGGYFNHTELTPN